MKNIEKILLVYKENKEEIIKLVNISKIVDSIILDEGISKYKEAKDYEIILALSCCLLDNKMIMDSKYEKFILSKLKERISVGGYGFDYYRCDKFELIKDLEVLVEIYKTRIKLVCEHILEKSFLFR